MKSVKIKTPESRLVTAITVNDPVRADLIRNMLADHGIAAQIFGEHQAGFTGTLPVEIVVRESELVAARTFIKEHFPEG